MKQTMSNLKTSLKAFRELGLRPSLALLLYRLGKYSSWYRRRVQPLDWSHIAPAAMLPFPLHKNSKLSVLAPGLKTRVDALLDGEVELFGAVKAPLKFDVPGELRHWTAHEYSQLDGKDIKYYWEPARFCWAADLVMAYHQNADSKLPEFFVEKIHQFMSSNPPFQGPHWANGQEVGLRLIHIVMAASYFCKTVPDLSEIFAQHAARIPPTLIYARAQSNNHLLSEAAALFTAGLVIVGNPDAERWQKLGWETFCKAVLDQFSSDGVYMQQSVNYHRLALQLAIWVFAAAKAADMEFPKDCLDRLAAATRHLLAHCDPMTGAVPNLGPNDGAYILPLTTLPFSDYRPVLQAAACAFLGSPAFEPGPWDDMGEWFGLNSAQEKSVVKQMNGEQVFLHHDGQKSRASLRAATFSHRPGHADQLHVDLWWQGINLAMDPGTYQYNASPPWDNALTAAQLHNTITVDGLDQMTLASRFLYVDRAQGQYLQRDSERQAAVHNGYRSLGLTHERALIRTPIGWRVEDLLSGSNTHSYIVRLHWLLPDFPWRLDGSNLALDTPHGRVHLDVRLPESAAFTIMLVKAGETLIGPGSAPTSGWFSPTYGIKNPALSFSIEIETVVPLQLESNWRFPKGH
jgi:hypothetical protein